METRSTLAGMMTSVIVAEGLVAFITPIGSVDESREGLASVIMAVSFDETNMVRRCGPLEDEAERTLSTRDQELLGRG